MGPYVVVTTRLETCENVGTNQVRYGVKMSRQGNRMLTYTNNVTFEVPWDDKLQMHLEFQQLKNGAYTSRFLTQSFKNCEHAWKHGKNMFKSFFGAAGYNMTKCPLPAGTYFVKDWKMNLEQFNDVPSFIYGSYKTIVMFSRDKRRVGCFNNYADYVPK